MRNDRLLVQKKERDIYNNSLNDINPNEHLIGALFALQTYKNRQFPSCLVHKGLHIQVNKRKITSYPNHKKKINGNYPHLCTVS
jgi:hypothetical protein